MVKDNMFKQIAKSCLSVFTAKENTEAKLTKLPKVASKRTSEQEDQVVDMMSAVF